MSQGNIAKITNKWNNSSNSYKSESCFYCGKVRRPRSECPAAQSKFNTCGKTGHWQTVYRQKIDQNKEIKAIDHIYTSRVHNNSARTPRIKAKLRYPNSETLVHDIPDTGAEVNVCGTKLLDQLQLCERDLRDGPYSKLVADNVSLLKKLGTVPITITLNETSIKDDIVICEGQMTYYYHGKHAAISP